MTRQAALASVTLAMCLAVPAASAQDSSDVPPAHISFVDGSAVLERDGRTDSSPASMPLLAGDRIRTQSGRVEILFADSSTLHVDNFSTIDFQSDEVVRLLDGRLRLNIAGQGRDVRYRIDAPGGWVQIAEAGEYRVAVLRGERDPQVELAVLRGAAELVNEDGRSLVRAGERAFARAGAQPSPPYVYNSAAWDAFDRWSEGRRDERLGVSAQYLPSDVRPYASTFDHYGSWRYEQAYGYVWYPRVQVAWRPYYHGRWVSLRPFGWTWIAGDPWGWPTHHYGRWGFSAGSWFWIPGRRWGAAWVSWAYAPDYVSWCPLGWNDRPVFSFINVNIFGGRHYDPWHAWTVIPRRHFGAGFVNVNVISGGRIDSRTRRTFVVRDVAPAWNGAVSRASASTAIRTAGRTGYAIPRGSSNSGIPGAAVRDDGAPGVRGFPAPAREPRAPSTDARSSTRSSSPAPVTTAPQRAVPRDRGVARETLPSGVDRNAGVSAPDGRRSADPRVFDRERRNDEPSTVPPAGTRAVPRRSAEPDSDRAPQRDWGRYDRPSAAPPARSAPEYRPEGGSRPDSAGVPQRSVPRWGGGEGYRRAPENEGQSDRSRAMPRQDAPRPSYEAPRRPSSETPRESPRASSPPPSRSPSADRPSRQSPPSGDSGQSRSRGGQPSQGHATRRPGGG